MRFLLALLVSTTIGSSAWASDGDMFNFRFDPIGALVGAIGVNLDYKIHPDWTIGPEFLYWRATLSSDRSWYTSDYDLTAFGVGVRANWSINGVYQTGLYVGPGLNYTSIKITTSDQFGSVSGTASALLARCLVGYGWFWDSFNILLGGGAAVALGSTDVTITDAFGSRKVSTNIAGLALEFSLGFTF